MRTDSCATIFELNAASLRFFTLCTWPTHSHYGHTRPLSLRSRRVASRARGTSSPASERPHRRRPSATRSAAAMVAAMEVSDDGPAFDEDLLRLHRPASADDVDVLNRRRRAPPIDLIPSSFAATPRPRSGDAATARRFGCDRAVSAASRTVSIDKSRRPGPRPHSGSAVGCAVSAASRTVSISKPSAGTTRDYSRTSPCAGGSRTSRTATASARRERAPS